MAGDYDYYLWMNDDTTFVDNGVLALLLHTDQQLRERSHGPAHPGRHHPAPKTGQLTYGGRVRLSPGAR